MPKVFILEYANDSNDHIALMGDFDFEYECIRDDSEELKDGRYWEKSDWRIAIKSGKGVVIRHYPGGCEEYFAQGVTISEAINMLSERSRGLAWWDNYGPAISVADHHHADGSKNNHF